MLVQRDAMSSTRPRRKCMNGVMSKGRAPLCFSAAGNVSSVKWTKQLGHQVMTCFDLERAMSSMA
jgi:hypothetical protein